MSTLGGKNVISRIDGILQIVQSTGNAATQGDQPRSAFDIEFGDARNLGFAVGSRVNKNRRLAMLNLRAEIRSRLDAVMCYEKTRPLDRVTFDGSKVAKFSRR